MDRKELADLRAYLQGLDYDWGPADEYCEALDSKHMSRIVPRLRNETLRLLDYIVEIIGEETEQPDHLGLLHGKAHSDVGRGRIARRKL